MTIRFFYRVVLATVVSIPFMFLALPLASSLILLIGGDTYDASDILRLKIAVGLGLVIAMTYVLYYVEQLVEKGLDLPMSTTDIVVTGTRQAVYVECLGILHDLQINTIQEDPVKNTLRAIIKRPKQSSHIVDLKIETASDKESRVVMVSRSIMILNPFDHRQNAKDILAIRNLLRAKHSVEPHVRYDRKNLQW